MGCGDEGLFAVLKNLKYMLRFDVGESGDT